MTEYDEYIINLDDYDSAIFLRYFREEIVRCKDCKYRSAGLPKDMECYRLGEYREFPVEPDGFCKWGERNKGGNN